MSTYFLASSTPINPNAKPPTIVLLDQNLLIEKSVENNVYGFSRFPMIFDPKRAPAVAPAIMAREIVRGSFSGDFLFRKK